MTLRGKNKLLRRVWKPKTLKPWLPEIDRRQLRELKKMLAVLGNQRKGIWVKCPRTGTCPAS